VNVSYCGRDFTEEDLELIRSLAAELATRTAIAEAACVALGWTRHDGRTAAMSARVALLRMARDGLVVLPPPRNGNGNGAIPARMEPISELPISVPTTLCELGPIELVRVDTKTASIRWRTLIATHHYLGYTPFAGAQLRFWSSPPTRRSGLSGSRRQRGRAHHETTTSAGTARPAKHDSTWLSATPGS